MKLIRSWWLAGLPGRLTRWIPAAHPTACLPGHRGPRVYRVTPGQAPDRPPGTTTGALYRGFRTATCGHPSTRANSYRVPPTHQEAESRCCRVRIQAMANSRKVALPRRQEKNTIGRTVEKWVVPRGVGGNVSGKSVLSPDSMPQVGPEGPPTGLLPGGGQKRPGKIPKKRRANQEKKGQWRR